MNIKELQVPASEVPESEVWFKIPIKPNWQVWLFLLRKLHQESLLKHLNGAAAVVCLSLSDPAASALLAGARRC